MAFTNQFSLSVELSNLVPLAPIVNLASRSMLEVVRGLHKSGSDLSTEHDLAEVLGRSYIEPRFVRNFKNAVRESTIRKLSGIAELILEAGAGPTVRNAVGDTAMFSMVVQLSLLLWAHHTISLATSLTKALEVRNSGSARNLPRLEDIVGTLRCISQQTSGFMWELVFAAVDAKLRAELQIPMSKLSRAVSYVVLRTLLDALPAVQRFPESHTLSVRTREGVTTLVIWAHHVLGLTVEIQSEGQVLKFGDGLPAVQIDRGFAFDYMGDEVVLLNETEDVIFQATPDALEDPELEPAVHHTLEGYGSITLETDYGNDLSIQGLVTRIIQSCLRIVDEGAEEQVQSNLDIRADAFIPSKQRIITIGRIMFPAYNISLETVEDLADRICLARAEWYSAEVREVFSALYLIPISYDIIVRYLRPVVKRLCHIVLALSTVRNIQDCSEVPLSTRPLPKETYQVVGLLNVERAFETIAYLFMGHSKYAEPTDHKSDIKRAVVISHRGWSLCISSIGAPDPGMLYSELAIVRGVPTREGQRKEWIQDHATGATWDSHMEGGDDSYEVVASEGDRVSLESFWPISESKYSIGTTSQAFLVFKTLTCYDRKRENSAYLRVGLRYMQGLFWSLSHVQPCEHVSQSRDVVPLPHRTWVFRGLLSTFGEALNPPHGPWALGTSSADQDTPSRSQALKSGTDANAYDSQRPDATNDANTHIGNTPNIASEPQITNESKSTPPIVQVESGERGVHISLSASNPAARWILVANAKHLMRRSSGSVNFAACYIRSPECCVQCAINFIKEGRKGMKNDHVALIA